MRDTTHVDLARVSEPVAYAGTNPTWWGRPLVWRLDQPGWFVPVAVRDRAGRVEQLTFNRLSAEEEALHAWAFPYAWGQLSRLTVVGTAQQRLVAAWFKRPAVTKTVEFAALYYDPRTVPVETVPRAVTAQVVNPGDLV